ncbi:g-patch domain-containing protein [Hirsutella rhossiliensis]|uniref:G-patch domain-containing protein n=1 Tax=Hirsutella rhossiliensis TaxID=111463 RepID=A0A9P8SI58_9HYPO|nr:g-patch domain-containing protein [Hirsutella rhossiliensis]KAH0962854.1 g-patch domain-containing protein [Hirsutella rhossiliensis]
MRRQRRPEQDEDDDESDVPLHHKKPFGAGLKRKRIEFVRATAADKAISVPATTEDPGRAVGDLYASIVLGGRKPASAPASRPGSPAASANEQPETCAVCSLPITTSVRRHETSLAHQVSLTHSHPPSALDRSRMGLRTLRSQGWDPDARRGLGLEGDGVRFPVKASGKDDNLGIGAAAPEPASRPGAQRPVRRLTAKEIKAEAARERQRAERLQAELYGRVDVERYLRGDGAGGEP